MSTRRICFKKVVLMLIAVLITLLVFQTTTYADDYQDTLTSQIKYQDDSTNIYIGSPSIVICSNGDLVASHDYFGPNAPTNTAGRLYQTGIYRSTNDGQTWSHLLNIQGAFWSSLFEHDGDIYLMGVECNYGDIVIWKSTDNGSTWATPTSSTTGILFVGGGGSGGVSTTAPNYHCAPSPVLKANGRLYRSFGNRNPYTGDYFAENYGVVVVSCDEDDDLLDASNWTMTSTLYYDKSWDPTSWTQAAMLEGNVVQAPNGDIKNILRLQSSPDVDKAIILSLSSNGTTLSFDSIIDFPGGTSNKFTIRYDPNTERYFSIVNNNTDVTATQQRNVLSLISSEDLENWRYEKTLIQDDSDLTWTQSLDQSGFQYVDFRIDGDDIIYISRTGYDGADDYHNANRLTFHRLEDYKDYLNDNGPVLNYKFDETSGSNVSDSSIYNNSAELNEGSWNTGKYNNGVDLDGINDYVDLNFRIGNELHGAKAVTISAWIKNEDVPSFGADNYILNSSIDGTATGIGLNMHGNNIKIGARSEENDSYQSMLFPYSSTNTWHHIVAIIDYENDDMKLYIDRVEQTGTGTSSFGSDRYARSSPDNEDTIGCSTSGSFYFNGMLDEIRIYDRKISIAELNALYDNADINLTDDFKNGISPYWNVVSGDWALYEDSNNLVYRQSETTGNEKLVTRGSSSWDDYTVEANVKIKNIGGSAGIVGRYQDYNNFYTFRYNTTGDFELYKKQSGTMTLIDRVSYSCSTNTWYTLRMEFSGSDIECYVDGAAEPIIEYIDSNAISSGGIGLRSWNIDTYYDNVLVTE